MAEMMNVQKIQQITILKNPSVKAYVNAAVQKIQQITILKNVVLLLQNLHIVQKIQQITILKNALPCAFPITSVQKIQQITILKNARSILAFSIPFKKYNKLQSLRTVRQDTKHREGSKNTTNYNP